MKKGLIALFGIALILLSLTNATKIEAKQIDFSEQLATGINEYNSFTNVAVFIRFADESDYEAPYNLEHYNNMFNGVDTLSLRDYYLEVSYNQLTINTYLASDTSSILYYEDTHERGYFMPYSDDNRQGYEDETMSEEREHRLLKDASDWVDDNNLIDDSVNLDVNDDGDIDSVTFMISGEDEGWYSLLWPHKWSMNSYYDYDNGDYKYNAPMINGKYVWDYTFELLGNTETYENIVDVAVLAHETFHLLSAPDLYHYYDYDWIEAIGYWGLMDSVDSVPSHMLGYMKYQYGTWIDSVSEITESGTYTLYPLQESAENLYRIPLGYSNEYIYLEYRDSQGLYESTLPDKGLIVYRVDEDFIDQGNESGYYESGNTNEEVWIFRPGMDDVISPITFDNLDPGFDIDGDIDAAAILSTNTYNAIGLQTETLLFDSEGNVLDYRIDNVIEHDGYITFDVSLEPDNFSITLNESEYSLNDDVILVDLEDTYYYLSVSGYDENDNFYYTLDGSTPTIESLKVLDSEIEITAENNIFTSVRIIDGQISDYYQKEFKFLRSFETLPEGTPNNPETHWFLNYQNAMHLSIEFYEAKGISTDFVVLPYGTQEKTSFSNNLPINEPYDIYGSSFVLSYSLNDGYYDYRGLLATVTVLDTFDSSVYYIEEKAVYHQIYYDFENAVQFVTLNNDVYHANMITNLDTDVAGSYMVTYEIYNDSNVLVDTLNQTVYVGDFVAPVITLISGDIILEARTEWIDPGYTVFDLSTDLEEMVIIGTVDTTQVGNYYITYQITDGAGNISDMVMRIVTVVPAFTPVVKLNPGIDTIILGENWIDEGVTAGGVFDTNATVSVTNSVDNTTAGKYIIYYKVEDNSGNVKTISRIVHVVESQQHTNIMLDCDALVITIEQGSSVSLPVCTYNDIEIEGTLQEAVSNNRHITYQVFYLVTIGDQEYILRKHIFVVPVFNDYKVVTYIERKRGDIL